MGQLAGKWDREKDGSEEKEDGREENSWEIGIERECSERKGKRKESLTKYHGANRQGEDRALPGWVPGDKTKPALKLGRSLVIPRVWCDLFFL